MPRLTENQLYITFTPPVATIVGNTPADIYYILQRVLESPEICFYFHALTPQI